MKPTSEILERIEKCSSEHKDGVFTRLYRYLLREDIYYAAYQKLYANKGATTQGIDNDTADGFSDFYVKELIQSLKDGTYKANPVRREYIPKKNGKLRPLGIPSFHDKLLQEVVRMILEAIYEPVFDSHSHGFRPGKSCHTALRQISSDFTGVVWFIEGDIQGCFDNINHEKLIEILSRKIKDSRFLNIIRQFLKAGYIENWKYNATYSGSPQGGICSPILANIYLNELDKKFREIAERFDKPRSAYPAPEILREESKVQPEAAAPTKAPQPVTPILLNGQNSAERMKEITDRLETGIQELFESERYKAYLTTMSKFHSYSFNNTLLIAMRGGQLVAGYNKWRDDFHRNVKKGEKAIKILAPAPFKAKKEVQKLDAQGRPVMGKDGKPVTEVQEIQVPAFKIVSVFDVSQTEGEPLPSIGVEELTGSVERYGEFFKALEQTSPVPIGFEDIPGGSHGYYHLTEKRIAIQEGMSELQTLKTAIHEIAHSKLHAIDPEAPAIEQADRPDSRTREVQAESVAYAVCQHYGLDTSDYSFGYVAGWSSGKDLKELKASLETIRATAHELITTIDDHLAQLQKERQAQQEQPQTAPLEQAAEQPDPDSVFSKLPPEQQREMTASVKAMLQALIDADLKSTGEVSQGTKEAAQAQGFTIAGDGTLEQAEAQQEAAYRLESGDYLYIQTSETGYDYTLYDPDYKELDGGQLDNPDLSLAEAGKEILAIHERPAGTMEPLTGDRLDDFLEATEQANAIPQPQSWNGIDGLLNGKLFMPEASPADRAVALMALAEKNAPRLGSEERQLIVAYAEAVGDNDKVIGLINRLCEQGYELQEGQIDSFVKSEIESEIAVANAQRQIAQNPAAEPVVTILWSESPHLKDGQQMPLHEAETVFKELDSARRHDREQPGYTGHWYDKTKFRIDFTMQGQPDSYEGRQDFGDGDGSLIQHIRGYHEYYAQDESWKNHVLHHEGPEAWEADKAQRDTLLHEFIPYMELHCNLAAMEQEARRPLRSGETLTPEQTAYFNAVLDYVKECRPLLNQGQYHLPEPPQLADFDQSLQDYKKQIEAELEQEAAASGLTVEEYVASDYEAPAQPNFSIYQVPPGPEGRDFRYRSYEDLQADGLSVDRKNYQLVYTAPLDKDTTLDEIYRRFNMEHPADYKGHSLSMGDIVVFRQDGKQTAYYVDEGADYRQVPEFFAQPEKQLTPDECMTGEQIQTPRGRFYLTDRSREQMEAAGYGFHHQSDDGRYLIMANGTRAFAIPAQQESHIKTAEMSTEQNYNMIDGMMNNAPSMEELEARAKAGEQISLLDVAEAAKAEAQKPKQTRRTTQKQKKPSIRAQLAAAKEEQKKRPPAREKSKEMEV